MNIGIIDSGKMGTGLGRLWATLVMFSYSRRPAKLEPLVLDDGMRVAVRWTWSGSHTGKLLGIASKRRKIEFSNTHLLRISGGRIAEDHVSAKLVDLLDQFGTA